MFNSIGKNVINVIIFMGLYQLSTYLIPQFGNFAPYLFGTVAGAIVMGINVATNINKGSDK